MEIDVRILPDCEEFLDKLDEKTKSKILRDIRKTMEGLHGEWFRKMPGTGDLWEFRTLFNKSYYRIFAFWHKEGKNSTLIVCTHGLIKKTDKTPSSDIEKAQRIRKEYIENG